MKGKRLHKMMWEISDSYKSLYVQKCLKDSLHRFLKSSPPLKYNDENVLLLEGHIRGFLLKKGFSND